MIRCPKCGLKFVISPFMAPQEHGHCALCGWGYRTELIDGKLHLFWDDLFILEVEDDLS